MTERKFMPDSEICAMLGHEWEFLALDPQRVDATCRRCGLTVENVNDETYARLQRDRVLSLAGAGQ